MKECWDFIVVVRDDKDKLFSLKRKKSIKGQNGVAYLDFSRIDDESDAVYGDGRFGDVGRHDALADILRRVVKHFVLGPML